MLVPPQILTAITNKIFRRLDKTNYNITVAQKASSNYPNFAK